ncbi:MAG: HAD family hydrolase [Candidatus Sabulitectum sp.]|nr:HAD family hydrolase [Candidatus Sabulitectum sp.]
MIRSVIFDFDGTLVDFVESDIAVLKYVCGQANPDCAVDEFIDAAIEGIMQFHELVERKEINPLLMHHYRLSRAFVRMEMDWDDCFVDLYKSQLLKKTKAYTGVRQLLRSLPGRAKLGIITNAYNAALQRERIEASGLEQFFQEILIAGEVGIAKPDPEIFLLMSRKLNVFPEECLFIGDSIHYDIKGAHSAGMKTVLYGKSKSVSEVPDYRAEDIRELAGLLENLIVQ